MKLGAILDSAARKIRIQITSPTDANVRRALEAVKGECGYLMASTHRGRRSPFRSINEEPFRESFEASCQASLKEWRCRENPFPVRARRLFGTTQVYLTLPGRLGAPEADHADRPEPELKIGAAIESQPE